MHGLVEEGFDSGRIFCCKDLLEVIETGSQNLQRHCLYHGILVAIDRHILQGANKIASHLKELFITKARVD